MPGDVDDAAGRAGSRAVVADADQGRPPSSRSLRRFAGGHTGHGAALGRPGLAEARRGPGCSPNAKVPNASRKLTADQPSLAIRQLREGGASYRAVGADIGGGPQGSVRKRAPYLPMTSPRTEESVPRKRLLILLPSPEARAGGRGWWWMLGGIAPPVASGDSGSCSRRWPVLADSGRTVAPSGHWGAVWADRVRAGRCSPGGARAPLAGLLAWRCPRWRRTGLIEDCAPPPTAALPNGFYSLDTMLCESVFRGPAGPGPRAGGRGAGSTRPRGLGRGAGFGPGRREVKTIRRKIRLLREAGRAGDWTGRRWAPPPTTQDLPRTDPRCSTSTGTVRRLTQGHPQGSRNNPCAAVEVSPPPATVGKPWVCDAVGGSAAG